MSTGGGDNDVDARVKKPDGAIRESISREEKTTKRKFERERKIDQLQIKKQKKEVSIIGIAYHLETLVTHLVVEDPHNDLVLARHKGKTHKDPHAHTPNNWKTLCNHDVMGNMFNADPRDFFHINDEQKQNSDGYTNLRPCKNCSTIAKRRNITETVFKGVPILYPDLDD
jgi:hypothetical protein